MDVAVGIGDLLINGTQRSRNKPRGCEMGRNIIIVDIGFPRRFRFFNTFNLTYLELCRF